MRILIPLDGSPLAEHALAPATQLAKHLQPAAEIVLVRIVRYPAVEAGLAGPYPGMSSAALLDDMLAEASAYLHVTAQLPFFAGLTVQSSAEMGITAQAIGAIARREHCELIMMTSHGRTGIGKLVLGSVAEEVIRNAQVPVLVVRPEGETFPDVGRFTPLTILVPLDGTPLCEAAIEPAATIARAFHGTLYLVRVLPAVPHAKDVTAQEAYAYLTVFHDRLTQAGITVHRSLGWGEPAEQIIAKAQEHRADIVAIATHGRTPLGQLLQGSIAATVLHQVPLPMLVVHPTATAQTIPPTTPTMTMLSQ